MTEEQSSLQRRESSGLFQEVDDSVVHQIGSFLIQQKRYHDLALLVRTNSRFLNVCQGLLTKEHEHLQNQPPTEDNEQGRQWRDSTGLLDRAFDLPAVIRKDGSMYWYRNGLIHRIGNPAVMAPTCGVNLWIQKGILKQINDHLLPIGKRDYPLVVGHYSRNFTFVSQILDISTNGPNLLIEDTYGHYIEIIRMMARPYENYHKNNEEEEELFEFIIT